MDLEDLALEPARRLGRVGMSKLGEVLHYKIRRVPAGLILAGPFESQFESRISIEGRLRDRVLVKPAVATAEIEHLVDTECGIPIQNRMLASALNVVGECGKDDWPRVGIVAEDVSSIKAVIRTQNVVDTRQVLITLDLGWIQRLIVRDRPDPAAPCLIRKRDQLTERVGGKRVYPAARDDIAREGRAGRPVV